jgi:hypothetical protein
LYLFNVFLFQNLKADEEQYGTSISKPAMLDHHALELLEVESAESGHYFGGQFFIEDEMVSLQTRIPLCRSLQCSHVRTNNAVLQRMNANIEREHKGLPMGEQVQRIQC